MKKIIISVLTVVLIFGVISFAVSADGFFGSGAIVVANEVDMVKTGLIGQKLCFSDADFKSALCLADFDTVTITKIPSSTEGSLLLAGRRVGEGKTIKRKNLASLVFVPASDSVSKARFSFTIDGYLGGAEIECIMKFIDKVNYAPKTEGASASAMKTQKGISLYGTLVAKDPEGDKISYIIVSYPKHGTISIADSSTGNYCYTPNEKYTGKDSFTFVARDEYGNYSEPEKVELRVNARMCDIEYADMIERSEYNAAVAMTAMNIMSGKILGDDVYFMPDETVTRAEFVAMAMKCANIRPDSTLGSTYFDDDAEIPSALKGYVATAQRLGLINGDFEYGKLNFSPNDSITKYEAAKIMASLLGMEAQNSEESAFTTNDAIPVWARAGVSAMCSIGIFNADEGANATATATRAEVASYLYKMTELI